MKKFFEIIKNYIYIKKFIKHNKKYFKNKSEKAENIILVELNSISSSIIAYSYLANFMGKHYMADIYAYKFDLGKNFFNKIYDIFFLRNIINYYKVYQSFGAKRLIENKLTEKEKNNSDIISENIFRGIKSKSDVLEIKIEGIEIGDLLYDSYLKKFNKSTIDIHDLKFKKFLFYFIGIFCFWKKYFEDNNIKIKTVVVSHCIYERAIPLRIALQNNIPCYQASAGYIYRLSHNNKFAYREYFNYKKQFSELSETVKIEGVAKAKERLQLRFSGKVGIDMKYSKKSAYGKFLNKPLLNKNNKIKILVATHCFSDSPHSFGNLLFEDFYEWLSFLGNLSEKLDYEWYLKTHPDFIKSTRNQIKLFEKKYNNFTLLPADASHLQLIEEGIDYVLTCHGTIGHEYAAKGKTVINASVNNPHINYNFNMHPKNIAEYKEIILNLKNNNFTFNKNEVYEYYFMKYINEKSNWLFKNYNDIMRKIGYKTQYKPVIFKIFLNQFNETRHHEVLNSLKDLISKKDYLFIPK
tara:strand:+ start:2007 stop:3575 length:1569 start_codon:yes stop_codon:yes gene_type:complete